MKITKMWMTGSAGLLASGFDIEVDLVDQGSPNIGRFYNPTKEFISFSIYWPINHISVLQDSPLIPSRISIRSQSQKGLRITSYSLYVGGNEAAVEQQTIDYEISEDWSVVEILLNNLEWTDTSLGLILHADAPPGSSILISAVGLDFETKPQNTQ